MAQPDDNRVVIVTGSSRGLGRAIAIRFGREGWRVVVNYREQEQAARDVVREIADAGGKAVPYKADVCQRGDIEAMVRSTMSDWGAIDVLVNNAGVTSDGLAIRMSEQEWDSVMDTNLTGPFNCIRAVSRHMIAQAKGHIINIASIVGLQGRAGQANYAASKAALIGLTKACAKELGPHNVQANVVLPGYLQTDMGGTVSQTIHDMILREHALGRPSVQAEVADFVHYLSCMKNVSGQVFNLDSRVI